MNKIGIISVDGHHFPNFALLKIAGYYQNKGIPVEWASPLPESVPMPWLWRLLS